jgi:4-amino-4-deoxy-L-arabinose transferase-like glycosyltransferase
MAAPPIRLPPIRLPPVRLPPAHLLQAGPAGLAGGLVLAALVVALLVPFLGADPPQELTYSNARTTDEGFNLNNARQRALSGSFATGDVDRSLTNGVYSAVAALVFRVTEPTLAAGRSVSVAATALAVLLLAVGLAEPLGRAAALLSAAALAGANLALEYGRLGMVEPTVVAFLTGGYVAAVHAVRRRSPLAGAGCGLLLAAAVSAKAIAVVPAVAILGVLLGSGLRRRDRRAVLAALAALGAAAAAAAAWFLLVALPNLERLRVALRIWPAVTYPHTPAGVLDRLGAYAGFNDQALSRSGPLLLAAVVGLGALVLRRRSLDPAARAALVMAGLWGFGLWLALAVGSYHPNRYVVPALPGMAVLAGFGLASLAARLRPDGGWGRAAVLAALGLLLAVPGAGRYLDDAASSGHQREQDQRILAAALPPDAVVFGHYAPTLLFDTRLELLTLWPSAAANADDPVARFGATHVLAAAVGDSSDPTLEIPSLRHLRYQVALPRVRWAGHTLQLLTLPPTPPPPRDRAEAG